MNEIKVPISPGELLDKITILRIKSERMSDPAKLSNVRLELRTLEDTWGASAYAKINIEADISALLRVNERLWVIEDDIRDKERAQAFDAAQQHEIGLPVETSGQRLLKIGFLHDRRKLEDAVAIGAELELRAAVIAEYEHFLHRRNTLLREPRPYTPALQTAHAAWIECIDAQVESRTR